MIKLKKEFKEKYNVLAQIYEVDNPEYAAVGSVEVKKIELKVYEGLIYEIRISDSKEVDIDMTLTSPNCPVAESLPKEVEDKVASVDGVESAKVHIVFDPPWDKDMMSEEAKLELGFL